MGLVYDEVYISAMREIDVCEKAIRKSRRTISKMELKYHIKTAEFIERFNEKSEDSNKEFRLWRESVEGLKGWEDRLKRLQEILANGC